MLITTSSGSCYDHVTDKKKKKERPKGLNGLAQGHRANKTSRPYAPFAAHIPWHWAPVPASRLYLAPFKIPLRGTDTSATAGGNYKPVSASHGWKKLLIDTSGRSLLILRVLRSGAQSTKRRRSALKSSTPSRRQARTAGSGTESCSAHRYS